MLPHLWSNTQTPLHHALLSEVALAHSSILRVAHLPSSVSSGSDEVSLPAAPEVVGGGVAVS